MSKRQSIVENLLPKSKFVRSVGVLTGGTVGAQVSLTLAAPVLTRLYSPEDFGFLAVFSGLLGIVSVLACLRYELAIPLPEDDQDAVNLLVLSLLIVGGISAIIFIPVFFFKDYIALLLKTPTLKTYLWLLPVGVLLVGIYQVLNYWGVRNKAFHVIARSKLSQSITTIAIQIGGFSLGPLALVLGQIAGQSAGSSILVARTMSKHSNLLRGVGFQGLRSMATRYRRFPIFETWSGLFNALSWQVPALLLAAFFGPAIAGAYALANRVLAMPAALVGQSISQVFFSSATDLRRNGTLAQTVNKVQAVLAKLILPFVLIFVVAGPELFSIVFGVEWVIAGDISRWLSIMIYFQFLQSPISVIFFVLEKQKLNLMMQALLLIVRVLGLLIGATAKNITLAVILYSIGSAVCYFVFLVFINRLSGVGLSGSWRPTFSALPISIISGTPVFLVVIFGLHGPVPVFGALVFSLIVAIVIFARSYARNDKFV